MADNVAITPGTGTSIATDEVGGVHYQKVKLSFGAADSATLVSAADPLPVDVGTVSVTGSFYPATQPVSIATMPSTPVTGTFWQATQPVSGTVTANAGSGTFAISAASLPLPSGAATAAKQPALGTAGSASADVITVQGIASGTAQPVTGTVTANAGSGTFAVSGTFWQATQPVSLASLPALVAGSALVGKVGIDQTTVGTTNAVAIGQIGSTTVATGNGAVGSGVQRVAIASDNTAFAVNATGPTLTKAAQGSTGYSVQNLKDAGRTTLAMTAEFTFAQTAETLLTMTLSSNSAATTTFSSRVITSGKRLRIQSAMLQVELLGSGTTPQRAYLRMRANTAGATTASSPLQWILPCGVTTAIVKATNWSAIDFPDGFELAGDGTATIGFTLETPEWVTTTATGRGKITVIGFEY